MTWTRLSDDHCERPAILGLCRSARLLEVEALVYANRLLTDGLIHAPALRRITDADDPVADAGELVAAGVWEVVPQGWQIVDFKEHQDSAERVKARKAANAKRQDKYRERQEMHARGDHANCDFRFCKEARNALPNGAVTRSVTSPLPFPTRPDPKGGTGTGKGADAPDSLEVVRSRAPKKIKEPQMFKASFPEPDSEGRWA